MKARDAPELQNAIQGASLEFGVARCQFFKRILTNARYGLMNAKLTFGEAFLSRLLKIMK
jgi:hypothetical protein